MSRVTEYKIAQRKNIGNYEHREVTITVAIDEHDDWNGIVMDTEVKLAEALGNQPKTHQIKEVNNDGTVTTNAGNTVDTGTGKVLSKKPAAKKKATRKKSAPKNVPVESTEELSTPEVVLTIANIKEKLGQVWKAKGKSVALDILQDFGAEKSDALREEDYGQVIEQCEKALV